MHRVTGTFELNLFQGHAQRATSNDRFHRESLPFVVCDLWSIVHSLSRPWPRLLLFVSVFTISKFVLRSRSIVFAGRDSGLQTTTRSKSPLSFHPLDVLWGLLDRRWDCRLPHPASSFQPSSMRARLGNQHPSSKHVQERWECLRVYPVLLISFKTGLSWMAQMHSLAGCSHTQRKHLAWGMS